MNSAHVLYKTGDKDIPKCALDNNNEVVLGICKICGKGESELDGPCRMTEVQISNWRIVLGIQFNDEAISALTDDQIIEIRDWMQERATNGDIENANLGLFIATQLTTNALRKKKHSKSSIKEKESPFDPKNNWFQKALKKGH